MKNLFKNTLVMAMGVALVGCEWGGGGDDNSWNEGGSIANFSGSYQAGSGLLVSDYSTSGGSVTTSEGTTYVSYTGEDGGNTGANRVSLQGKTLHGLVKPGSLTIVFGGVSGSAYDDGDGNVKGSYVLGATNLAVTSGHIEYDTGVWVMQLTPPGLPVSQSITLNYAAAGAASSGGSSSGGGSGASGGISIYAFNVQHSGNKIKIVDNNGSVYEGSFGEMRTTGNASSGSSGVTLAEGDKVIAPFSAAGKSAAGVHVNIAGSFEGTVTSVQSTSEKSGSTTVTKTSFTLTNRVISGTWIEDGGKSGNIQGVSGSSSSGATSTTTTG